MQKKDKERLNVLRGVIADVTNATKANTPMTTDLHVLGLLRRRLAAGRDAAAEFTRGNRPDLARTEETQIAILEQYAAGVQTMLFAQARHSRARRSSRSVSSVRSSGNQRCSRRAHSTIQMAIEAISTVHATDFKADEVEIGIVSEGEEEDPRTKGQWRVMDTAEIEQHLLAYAEKD